MDKRTAEKLFKNLFKIRNYSDHPFTPAQEESLKKHCRACAEMSQKIAAETPYLNPKKAYIFGLLHDYGRFIDEQAEKVFHGLSGYYALAEEHPEVARICLSHSFPDKDFNPDCCPMPREIVEPCKKVLENIQYDDYDRLIQLVDSLNMFGKPCTIDERYEDVIKRYSQFGASYESLESHINLMKDLKRYFDNMCQKDVYEILGIKQSYE